MSNEVEILENPTSTPELVSTGYQRQNTNMVAGRTGIDSSYVEGGVGQVTAYISGPIDVNGILYNIKSNTVLNPATAGRWFIYLDESGSEPQYLTPTLTQVSGSFDASKNARYTSGLRILNWIIDYDGTDCVVERWLTPESDDQNYIYGLDTQPETYISTNTTWTSQRSKFYTIEIQAKGGDGGNAQVTAGGSARGGDGGQGYYGKKRIFINAGDTWTSVISSSSGGNTTFSDGSTTLSVQNGFNGSTGLNGSGSSGSDGSSSSGFDIDRNGTFLGKDGFTTIASVGSGSNGNPGRGYGSGGSGGYINNKASGPLTVNGGTGGSALIKIIG